MASSIITALRKEIAALERELAGDPRFRKWKRLMDALDAYLEEDEDEPEPEASPLQPPHSQPIEPSQLGRPAPTGRTQSDRNGQILDIATEIITEKGGQTPIPTRDILAEVQRRGVEVHGREPRNTLSALLSYSQRFKAHGRSGWTLKAEGSADKETEAEDEPRLRVRLSTASAEHRLASGGAHSRPVDPRPGGGT